MDAHWNTNNLLEVYIIHAQIMIFVQEPDGSRYPPHGQGGSVGRISSRNPGIVEVDRGTSEREGPRRRGCRSNASDADYRAFLNPQNRRLRAHENGNKSRDIRTGREAQRARRNIDGNGFEGEERENGGYNFIYSLSQTAERFCASGKRIWSRKGAKEAVI